MDQVFAAAGMALARIPAQAQYSTAELRAQLREAMAAVESAAEETEAAPAAEVGGTDMSAP